MSTALYRRYRPETFAEVIGQEQVTVPLMTALEKTASTTPTFFPDRAAAVRLPRPVFWRAA